MSIDSDFGLLSASSYTLKEMKEAALRKKKLENAYDINNIVIPYSMAASTRVEKLQYKEIVTPKYDNVFVVVLYIIFFWNIGHRHDHDCMVIELKIPVQSVPITTKVVSWNPVYGEVYTIQHYVIKFVSDLRQVGGFLRFLRFPPPIKLTATI